MLCRLVVPVPILFAQQTDESAPVSYTSVDKPSPSQPALTLIPEFLWSGAWESRHKLTSRFDFKLTVPKADIALRLEVLDRRPALITEAFNEGFGGKTGDKVITQPGFGLYHLSTGSRVLYGVLDSYGLPARIRNVWIRGVPYVESRLTTLAELKTSPSSTAVPHAYAHLESPDFLLKTGKLQGFTSFTINDNETNRALSFSGGVDYSLGKDNFRLEGFYTQQTLPERKFSTWFSEKPALTERPTRLFAGSVSFSVPTFGLAADIACSETFAFGKDYYGNLGLRFGDKPWRLSLALDAAGSRYVDSSGGVPGAGFRTAAHLERRGKKTNLFRLGILARGPGPDQGTMHALGNFAAIAKSFDRVSGELYYRFPANSASFGLTRFTLSMDRDSRNEKKILDSANAMAVFKLGPVNSISEWKITGISRKESVSMEGTGYQLDSFRLSQRLSCSIKVFRKTGQTPKKSGITIENSPKLGGSKPSSLKKDFFTVQLFAKVSYEKTAKKEGIWDTSCSVSVRGKKNRLTIKAATPVFPKKWEYTISWRMQF